jgi:hypothetical protein
MWWMMGIFSDIEEYVRTVCLLIDLRPKCSSDLSEQNSIDTGIIIGFKLNAYPAAIVEPTRRPASHVGEGGNAFYTVRILPASLYDLHLTYG